MHELVVWIIDDDEVNNYLCKKTIEISPLCALIKTFTNGREPLQILREATGPEALPDLILLDINMPLFNGWDFLNDFKTIPLSKKVKVAMLTSSNYEKDVDRARQYEVVIDYFSKPLLQQHLSDLEKKLSQ